MASRCGVGRSANATPKFVRRPLRAPAAAAMSAASDSSAASATESRQRERPDPHAREAAHRGTIGDHALAPAKHGAKNVPPAEERRAKLYRKSEGNAPRDAAAALEQLLGGTAFVFDQPRDRFPPRRIAQFVPRNAEAREILERHEEAAAFQVPADVLPEVGQLERGAYVVRFAKRGLVVDFVEGEDQTADGVRRAPAVGKEVVPRREGGVARVHPKGLDQVEERLRG